MHTSGCPLLYSNPDMGISSNSMLGRMSPKLEKTACGFQLFVHGKPFLILGAELHNSSFSCSLYMQHIWANLKSFHVNTILANVSWEDIEPEEGLFDFARIDQAIVDARRHGFHLILLWFGAFKNAKSTYAPSWVKRNAQRFPRAVLRNAKGKTQMTDAISIFTPTAVSADAAAFQRLMRHIKEVDQMYSTVLMVQVENEVGILGDSRDASPFADEEFERQVPAQLVRRLSESWDRLHPSLRNFLDESKFLAKPSGHGSWKEVFGEGFRTDEIFMAYHFAQYIETIAQAGKAEYDLPMFTNVWQNYADEDADVTLPVVVGGGGEPGDYPSGGGVINVLDIWQEFAPSLDFIAPDLYLNDYNAVCQKYKHRGQPLFIPEQRRDEHGARRIWSAYGTYHALCASPFGIDSLPVDDQVWKRHYSLLSQVQDHILAAQSRPDSSFGFFFDESTDERTDSHAIVTHMGGWKLSIERSFVFGKTQPGFGMIIQLTESRFMLIGEGFQVGFDSVAENCRFTGILSFREKIHDPATKTLKDGRILNGDETRSGRFAVMPSELPDLGTFPICITVPARTRIAECEVYALF